MKRICIMILVCMLVPMLLIGCSGQKSKDEIGKAKEVNKLRINPEKVMYTDKRNSTDDKKVKKVVEIIFSVKNEGKKELGIGAGDFSVFDAEGNNLELYGYPDNFGDVVSPGKELKGKAYYKVEGKEPRKLVFENPDGNKKIEWEIAEVRYEK
ncbi:hypothetical protein BWGOE3_52370 [Bacillus mycoides]|uniref:DUF4352 domain-containing protein n=1 Tax=Bacillus cereus group TaxID=86661 RepID=UPI000871C743|nr:MULTISPECIES: DUF4352 domain-containing protein [Bacillus cereus group]MDM5465100.1 DUF4352 domain-containing protein [Bacillus cereus]OFD38232.1 hypothetical protein BWGOE3_52370 [Bacillus mycoides]OFD40630.1 hypothetical protein BWGOE1_52280 [Bacillus mycoides]OFD55635.1 hypothetical protein BWGOE6_52580 [Bacillus mycoides]